MPTKKTLADVVAAEGLLAGPRLAAAVERSRLAGEPLVVGLVELDHLDEHELAAALSRHLELPLAELAPGDDPEADALRQVSHELARAHRALPLALEVTAEGRVLRVAMADPSDAEAIAELEAQTGCRLEPVVATLAAVDDALARAYHGLVTAVMRRDGLGQIAPLNTDPYHNLEEQAPLEVRHRALVDLLVRKGVIAAEDYWDELRKLLQERG
jgi:type II secretion system (T2SS) protein E